MPRASITASIIAALVLASTRTAPMDDALGRLRWGIDPATGASWRVPALRRRLAAGSHDPLALATRSILRCADEDIAHGVLVTALPRVAIEGVLPSDPRSRASEEGTRLLSALFGWALCARLRDGDTARACGQRAVDAIVDWVGVYEPTGNPIDEAHLLPLVEAIDLALPLLTAEQKATTRRWLARLIAAGDRHQAAKPVNAPSRSNNQEAWHLTLRAVAGRVLGDAARDAETATMMRRLLERNLDADDGSSFDFHQRDAVHYHVYALEAYTQVLLLAPDVVDGDGRRRILRSLQFLEPYYTGARRHLEFAHSTVPFDEARRADGAPAFQHRDWEPSQARRLLRLARTQFPELRRWTGNVVDERYDPILKFEAALFPP